MIPKTFAEISQADIELLIENAVSESKTLEYKESLPDQSREEKKEFVADVLSLANSGGGDLLFGIQELRDAAGRPTGIPQAVTGLAAANIDTEILRLESLLRDTCEPRLPSLQIRAIADWPTGPVLLLRIPQSWHAPHRSKLDDRFYSRTNAGKYPLDVTEIRSAFLLSNTLAEQVRLFRDNRIARIISDEIPVRLPPGPRLIIHAIPAVAVQPTSTFEIFTFIQTGDNRNLLRPIGAEGWRSRYNIDGFVTYTEDAYSQWFSSGAVEMVSASYQQEVNGCSVIPGLSLARNMVEAVETISNISKYSELPNPVFFLASLLDVANCHIAFDNDYTRRTYAIDRDFLVLPDLRIDNFDISTHNFIRPVFDALWRAVGYPRCTYYSQDGRWIV